MSPVKQTAPRSVVLAIASSLLAVAGVVALIVFVLAQSSGSNVEVRLGSERFEAGAAADRADAVRRDGPILLPDPAGGTRDIYLQHLGATDEEGWLAFDSRRTGTGRDCTLVWDADADHFSDPCGGPPVPADGAGLFQYPVEVTEDGGLVVDTRGGRT